MNVINSLIGVSLLFSLATASAQAPNVELSPDYEVAISGSQVAAAIYKQEELKANFSALDFYDLFKFDTSYQVSKTSATFSEVIWSDDLQSKIASVDFYKLTLPDTKVENIVDSRNFTATTYFKLGSLDVGSSTAKVIIHSSMDEEKSDILKSFLSTDPGLGKPAIVVHTHYYDVQSLGKGSLQLDAYYPQVNGGVTVVQYFVSALDLPPLVIGMMKKGLVSSVQDDRSKFLGRLKNTLSK